MLSVRSQFMDADIPAEAIEGLNASEQTEVMKRWFFSNFEDPAHRTPYESAEGGYIWIWGGPYDAREEIEGHFYQYANESAIDQAVEDIECYGFEWAPVERPGDYDDYLIDDITSITEAHHNFSGAILDIERLLESTMATEVECNFCRLLYVNVITALETFLSDAFISNVMGDEDHFKAFVKSDPDFQKRKISLSDVLEAAESLDSTVKSHLTEVVWHNIERVSNMYQATFGITFPKDLGNIYRAVLKRHDVIHRNGKTKDGEEILITRADVAELIQEAEKLAQAIDTQLETSDF